MKINAYLAFLSGVDSRVNECQRFRKSPDGSVEPAATCSERPFESTVRLRESQLLADSVEKVGFPKTLEY